MKKFLIIGIFFGSCALALFAHVVGPQLHGVLGLSRLGLASGKLWQVITYILVPPTALSYGLILYLGLVLSLLAAAIRRLNQLVGGLTVALVFWVATIVGGLFALWVGGPEIFLAGPSCGLRGLLGLWILFEPHYKIYKLSLKWVILFFLGLDFACQQWLGHSLSVPGDMAGFGVGYLVGIMGWDCRSLMTYLHPCERLLSRMGRPLRNYWQQRKHLIAITKVFDIKTGQGVIRKD